MSHGRERKEKNCLNCGTIVLGRYCQVCGQQNLEPKESFWSMLRHFFEDITHFDGKFFTTLKDLLFRPGFLSAEYIKGRRQSYLHPVRMYVFTSAIFFLVFFSISNTNEMGIRVSDNSPLSVRQRDSIAAQVVKALEKNQGNLNLQRQIAMLRDTGTLLRRADLLPYSDDFIMISPVGKDYKTRAAYDSAQRVLPVAKKDGWLARLWNKKVYTINDKYRYDRVEGVKKMIDAFLHRLPYLLFVSLPFFALLLRLLYIRRKNFYYADHGIFSIHHYIFSFILLLVLVGWGELKEATNWEFLNWVMLVTFLSWLVYLYLAMKRFYGQGRVKTFFKFILLNFIGLILISILILLFFLFSVFQL